MRTATRHDIQPPPKRHGRLLGVALVCACIAPHSAVFFLQHVDGVPLWLAELARFVPYYWVLLPALLALGFSLVLPRVWLVLSLANVVVLATVTMGLHWNTSSDDGMEGTRLRVLTYNVKAFQAVHRQGGLDAIALEIRRFQPDIVALQDANSWVVSRSDAGITVAPPMFGLPHVVAMGQYVVASRFPLSACEPGKLDFRDASRQYLRCLVNIHGKSLQLVTAHFVSPREALVATRRHGWNGVREWQVDLADRLTQSRTLAADVSRLSRPLLLMGDLNAQEASPVVVELKRTGLRDAFSAAGRGYGYTHGHSLSRGLDLLRIDHILASTDIGVVHSQVGGGEASEHNPVVADLVLGADLSRAAKMPP
ncbi:MAG: endonuclease/exonuclease/phosphatase family protein [Burkholderiales bacterium]|nr:endonuclease/exonuclease/phosphatase family protein [Burkholderiales bacterium]